MSASVRELDNIDEWIKEWDNFDEKLTSIKDNEYTKLMTLMQDYHRAQTSLKKQVDMQVKNMKAFAISLQRIGNQDKTGKNKEKLLELRKRMTNKSRVFDEFHQGLPKTAGWFLKACIGEINVSLFWDKQHYKEVYEKFKLKMMIIAMMIGIINLIIMPQARFFDAIFHGILVWYYSSLTLQEQILRANGSRIKGWYVTHHYLSILVSGFLLIWPKSVTYNLFRSQFYYFVIYLSFVQMLQYYYQQGMLYKLRALGHGKQMDLTGDGLRSSAMKGLGFLLPFLVVGYAFQVYNAITLYYLSYHPECHEWQVLASAVLFFFIACGNVWTLMIVLRQKMGGEVRLPCG
eukprot:TCONS_00058318-protein